MLCLASLIPGKVGRVVRIVSFLLLLVVIAYFVVWALILKSFDIKLKEAQLLGDRVSIKFIVENNSSSAPLDVMDINFKDASGEYVEQYGFEPCTLKPRESSTVEGIYAIAEYDEIEIILKALYKKYVATSPLQE
ncbi:hypothetical protein ENBRE01_0643 [Enteropsectra breve]|nr:hypothetical protein ENBRE01_0643 [Enteropsectra breve]